MTTNTTTLTVEIARARRLMVAGLFEQSEQVYTIRLWDWRMRQLTRDLASRIACTVSGTITRLPGRKAASPPILPSRPVEQSNDLRDGPDVIGDAGLAGGCFGQRSTHRHAL